MNQIEKYDWNYRLVRYFLRNKQLTALLLAIVVLGGLFAFSRFRVEGFPAVSVPVTVVTTILPGAGPETVDSLITMPLEGKLKDIKGLKDISSTSSTSVSNIVLFFEDSEDINSKVAEVRTKIASVRLPETAVAPEIFVPETGGAPFVLAVTGPKSLTELLAASENYKEELLNIDEVTSVTQFGKLEEQIVVELPAGLASEQVIAQIRGSNTGFPLGQAIVGEKQIPLSSSSQVKDLEDLQNFQIRLPDRTAKLGDIARVYKSLDTNGEINRVGFRDGDTFRIQSGVLLVVRLNQDADVIETGEKVVAALERVDEKQQDIRGVLVSDQAEYSKQQVDEIIEGALGGKWDFGNAFDYVGYLFGGIWLLVIVMLFFLDWRSSLVSLISIPLSFLATFLVLNALGIQLNTIVLFSLVLVLGLIVDPAIVVLESIKRYMEVGYKGEHAVLRSVGVIGQGLFMAVLTSLIVFVPFGVVGGTFGQIIKYIPLTVIPALIASYFVPMIFLTWLAGKFLKARAGENLRNENDPHTLWPVARWFIKANRFVLARRWLSVTVIVLGLVIPIGIAAAFIGAGKIKQVQFAGSSDSEMLAITAPLPQNITPSGVIVENSKLETVLKNYAGLMRHYYYSSAEGGSGTNGSINVLVQLLPVTERDIKSPEIARNMTAELQRVFGDTAFVQEIGAGPPEQSYPVMVKIFENDSAKIKAASERIAAELRSYPEVTSVKYDSEKQAEDITIRVNPEKAQAFGLVPEAVYGQIASRNTAQTVTTLNGTGVVLKLINPDNVLAGQPLEDTVVFGSNGPVKLSDVADIQTTQVPGNIFRTDGSRYGQVSARVKETKDVIAVQRKINDWVKANYLSLGVSERAFEDRGAGNDFEESFQQLFLAIGLSILITYIVLVLFFKSFIQPFIILFSIPLLAIGIFPALAFFAGGQLGFLEILGVIMVIGIVENVGIFLIDYANREVGAGMDKREAISLSSGIRFRPIILTKLTALAGLLPLAIFAPFWRGLAVVVIMGIISSGILSLFTTPVLYTWFTRVKKPAQSEV